NICILLHEETNAAAVYPEQHVGKTVVVDITSANCEVKSVTYSLVTMNDGIHKMKTSTQVPIDTIVQHDKSIFAADEHLTLPEVFEEKRRTVTIRCRWSL